MAVPARRRAAAAAQLLVHLALPAARQLPTLLTARWMTPCSKRLRAPAVCSYAHHSCARPAPSPRARPSSVPPPRSAVQPRVAAAARLVGVRAITTPTLFSPRYFRACMCCVAGWIAARGPRLRFGALSTQRCLLLAYRYRTYVCGALLSRLHPSSPTWLASLLLLFFTAAAHHCAARGRPFFPSFLPYGR